MNIRKICLVTGVLFIISAMGSILQQVNAIIYHDSYDSWFQNISTYLLWVLYDLGLILIAVFFFEFQKEKNHEKKQYVYTSC